MAQLSQYNGFFTLGGRKGVFGRHKRGNFDDDIFKCYDMEPWGEMKKRPYRESNPGLPQFMKGAPTAELPRTPT